MITLPPDWGPGQDLAVALRDCFATPLSAITASARVRAQGALGGSRATRARAARHHRRRGAGLGRPAGRSIRYGSAGPGRTLSAGPCSVPGPNLLTCRPGTAPRATPTADVAARCAARLMRIGTASCGGANGHRGRRAIEVSSGLARAGPHLQIGAALQGGSESAAPSALLGAPVGASCRSGVRYRRSTGQLGETYREVCDGSPE